MESYRLVDPRTGRERAAPAPAYRAAEIGPAVDAARAALAAWAAKTVTANLAWWRG